MKDPVSVTDQNAFSADRGPAISGPSDARQREGSSAIVIGSGFGGLALAIRLQSAGIATTIVEARDRPGGRAYVWKRDGFNWRNMHKDRRKKMLIRLDARRRVDKAQNIEIYVIAVVSAGIVGIL